MIALAWIAKAKRIRRSDQVEKGYPRPIVAQIFRSAIFTFRSAISTQQTGAFNAQDSMFRVTRAAP